MANVRFYRLGILPNYVSEKHQGIFVHVTTGNDTHKAGLWFGGANGWEYLTNDTTPESITAAIDALNAGGFTQATIGANTEGSESATGSTLTISGIKETKGKIEQDNTKNVNIAIDGVYNESNNKIATQSTVTNAINGLNVDTIQAVTTTSAEGNTANTVLTFNGVKEVNGKILQGDGTSTFTVGDAKLNIEIGSDSFEVFSANAKENKSIYLDKNVFKKNVDGNKNVLSIYTTEGVSSTNPLVTQKDIASLGGAMHYKGSINDPSAWPETVKAGDVYIVTGDRNFIYNGQQPPIEPGDMIVFNSETVTDFTVVQSNLTLGTGGGQIAKNDGNLTPNNMVIATSNGIKTIGISETDLTNTTEKNTRTLTYVNGTADGTLYHSATITDTFKVIGKDFTKSINISSANRSIEITRNAGENDSTGVIVDLVWNTTMDSNPNN